MDWNIKKVWPLAALTLMTATNLLSAGSDEGKMMPEQGMARGVTAPSAQPDLKDGKGGFITVDAFYWKANVDGLTPAITNTTPLQVGSQPSFFTGGQFNHMKQKWNPGFKLGVGGRSSHDEWDIYLNWTYFHTHANLNASVDTQVSPSAQQIAAIWSSLNNDTMAQLQALVAQAKWSLRLNMVDLELGRNFFAGKWLAFRPFIGLRGTWINQNYDVNYFGGSFQESTALAPVEDITNRNRFRGGGIRAGIDTQWNIGAGWGLYGNAAISIIYGKFNIRQAEYRGPDQDPTQVILSMSDQFHTSRAITDLAVGVRYEYMFKDSASRFCASLGWEQHMFFDQNELNRFNTLATSSTVFQTQPFASKGNLSTQGFTLSFRFDF